jgi:hypothetical protein
VTTAAPLDAAPATAGVGRPLPRKYHVAVQVPGLSWRASCNMSTELNKTRGCPAARVDAGLRCHRRGCHERWLNHRGRRRCRV